MRRDYMAMGNYPYPSSYILNGNGELPAYPVRVACEALAREGLEGTPLLTAFAESLGVFYNYSGVRRLLLTAHLWLRRLPSCCLGGWPMLWADTTTVCLRMDGCASMHMVCCEDLMMRLKPWCAAYWSLQFYSRHTHLQRIPINGFLQVPSNAHRMTVRCVVLSRGVCAHNDTEGVFLHGRSWTASTLRRAPTLRRTRTARSGTTNGALTLLCAPSALHACLQHGK